MTSHRSSLSCQTGPLFAGVLVAIVIALLVPTTAFAQDRFQQARELAFGGEREAARELLRELLEDSPNHWDARILLGRTLAWDDRHDEAREELLLVVRAKPDYADARVALIDVEMWADNPTAALGHAEEGLRREATEEDLLYRKAWAQRDLEEFGAAALTLSQLLQINPSHQRGNDLYRSVRLRGMRTKFDLSHTYTEIDSFDEPWNESSASLSHRTGIGSIIGRVNYSRRFGESTHQYEVDAYPRLMDGVYLYLNYGFSPHRLFPRHRYGGEMYANLDGGWELSAGFRRLEFTASDVTIYTGSVAKYVGNWWVSVRPYVTPKSVGTSRSLSVSVRRYFSADAYLGITAGTGSSPDEIRDTIDLVRLDSWKVALRGQAPLSDFVILKYGAGFSRDELAFARERDEFNVSLGLSRRF